MHHIKSVINEFPTQDFFSKCDIKCSLLISSCLLKIYVEIMHWFDMSWV